MSDALVIEADAGTITLPSGALASLVARAADEVAGARVRRRGVDVELAHDTARVRIELSARYGSVLPELGRDVQRAVADALSRMCGISTAAVDLHVGDLE